MMDVVPLLQSLIRLPSVSGQEDAVVCLLDKTFTSLGWKPVRSGNNIHVLLGTGGPLLLLNSHSDTVPIGEAWTKDPLGAAIESDGKIYGRGSNDAKGCVAAMIAGANAAYAKEPPPGRVVLAITAEEEISGKGLEYLIKDLPKPDAAVVGEPTGLQPAVAQKGLLLLTVTAKGRSAHAAWGGGKNAVEAAARDVLALSSVGFDRPHPALGLPSVAVTLISGGTRHNIIPDRCKLTVDIRTTPSYTPAEIIDLIKKRVEGEVEVRSERLLSVDTDPSHPIVKAALSASPGAVPFGSPTASDWVFLKGVPTVKAGPGDSRRSHTPDEYITAPEAQAGSRFYERLIRSYLSNEVLS